jgi:hypothetical protein
MLTWSFPLGDRANVRTTFPGQCILAAFPDSVVDDGRANEILLAELKQLEASGKLPRILPGHKNLFHQTTCVEIYASANRNLGIQFMIYPDSAIDVHKIASTTTPDESDELDMFVRQVADELAYDPEFTS